MNPNLLTRLTSVLRIPLRIGLTALLFFLLFARFDAGQAEEHRRQLEETLRLSATAYYASEGCYPPTIDRLLEQFSLTIDPKRYAVFYDAFAENLMPEITVVNLP